MNLISIIIPIYNTEKYLDKCIQSVRNQTYRNIEILLIDDGSTDNSGKMCDEYAKEDDRIRVFHKENGGQGSARNLGLDEAKGEYIAFVDSDDYLDLNYLHRLMNSLLENEADAAMCNITDAQFDIVRTYKDFYENLLMDKIGSQLWRFLFNRRLWEGMFIPVNRYAEDAMILPKVLYRAKKLGIVNAELYHYYEDNPESSSNKNSNISKNAIDRAIMFIDRLEWIDKLGGFSSTVKNTVIQKATEFSIGALGCYRKYNYEKADIKYIKNFLKENKRLIMQDPLVSKFRKIAVIIISISPSIYYRIRGLWARR